MVGVADVAPGSDFDEAIEILDIGKVIGGNATRVLLESLLSNHFFSTGDPVST